MIKNWYSYSKWFSISSSWMHNIYISIPSNNHWVHQWSICNPVHTSSHDRISKHHLRYPTTLVIVVGSIELWLKFLHVEIPLNSLPNFVANPISTPLLTTFMLGITTISVPVVVIRASSDWVTFILACCLRVSTIVVSNYCCVHLRSTMFQSMVTH